MPETHSADSNSIDADEHVAWTDLPASRRDLLEAIYRLETDGATVYGLAIKGEFEHARGEEVGPGLIYPNLRKLEEVGLVEKREIDGRTNEYLLTDRARAMIRERVYRLADACGLSIAATDGGDDR